MTLLYVTRAGAAGLLTAGVLAWSAAPALAADVDFGVDIKGTTVAVGSEGKQVTVTVSNHGATEPSEVRVRFDVSDVNRGGRATVDLGVVDRDCGVDADGYADCVLDKSRIPAPGGSVDLAAYIHRVAPGSTGQAGTMTVSVEVDGDSNETNDSDTVEVTLAADKGVDLAAYAEDVTLNDGDRYTGEPIPAGGKSVAEGFVTNYGDRTAAAYTAEAKLPEGVTFVEQQADGCDFSADRRTVRCRIGPSLLSLPPRTGAAFRFGIVVAPGVKGPATLQNGSWTFVADQVVEPDQTRAAAPRALPGYLSKLDAAALDTMDVDPSDDTDGFAVLVAGPAGGNGGGTGGGTGDDGPGLPVTGPVAGTIAGAGGAVLFAGTIMFLVARRRRVVLVTPGDER